MTITREQVQQAADDLASYGWVHRDEPGELERVAEIRELVEKQLKDSRHTVVREGDGHRGRTLSFDRWISSGNEENFWSFPPLTDDQLSLEYGLQPILKDGMTIEDLDLIRWVHAAGLTERQIVEVLPKERMKHRGQLLLKAPSQKTVNRRIKAVHAKVLGLLASTFPLVEPSYEAYRALLVERGRHALEAERRFGRR